MLNKLFVNKTYTTDLSSEDIIARIEEYLLAAQEQDKNDINLHYKEYRYKYDGKIEQSGFTLTKRSHGRNPFIAKAYCKVENTGKITVLNLVIRPADYGITAFIFSAFMFYIAYTTGAWPFFLFVVLVLIIGIFDFIITSRELERFIRIELLNNNPEK